MSTTINPLYKDLPTADSKAIAANLDKWLVALQERVSALEEINKTKDLKITELEDRIKKIEQTNGANPISAANFWNNLPKNVSNEISNIATRETKNQNKKEKNLIVFGIPESTETEPQAKIDSDKTAIETILEKIGVDVSMNNTKIIRFKRKANSTQGIVLVECENVEKKVEILRAARKLRESAEHKNVYINQDLTEAEQAEDKKLRKERDEKNAILPNIINNKKYGMHKFGDDASESKFYWGIRNGVVRKIKSVDN